ncbi:MAG TPA: hypothetical protein VJK51_03135 [Candidatus Nanoarchaeia archaeon]|nr:hypothetical protein [Candidatus Nanoarchaeia archaeon]
MKQIETYEIREARDKRRLRIMSVLLLVILLGSTAGYAFMTGFGDTTPDPVPSQASSVSYAGQEYPVRYSRAAVADIVVPPVSLNQYVGQPLYIVSENPSVLSELAVTLGRVSGRVQEACLGSCEKDLPEKSCSDNVVVWKEAKENSIRTEEQCVFIEGDLRAVDAFIYSVFSTA